MEIQFFACVPAKVLELPEGFQFSQAGQRSMIHEVFQHPLYHSYPPPVSYQITFLKWCISQAETQKHEVCDELYELYGSLISQPQDTHNTHCFKSYFIGLERYITVKESTHIISAGTTGLTTWQAAYHFVEWAVNNTDHFNRKHVLELGSGVGLVGLAVCSSCTPSSYCFTDCHPQVLSLLSHNIRLNFPDGECGTEVSVKEMDWNSSAEDIISTYTNSQPLDCIIATDVVYDTEVINAFVHVLATLLKHWPGAVAYVTSTVRNEETYQNFISQLDASHILKRIIQTDSSSSGIFYYDRTQHFQMLKLDMNPQS